MPTPNEPPNRSPFAGMDQRAAPVWQRWFTAIHRSLFPSDYFYIPTISGAPTATPETRTGFVPMVYDTANEKLYVYNGGWVSVTLA